MLSSRVTSSSLCWTWLQGFLHLASPQLCPAALPQSITLHLVSQRANNSNLFDITRLLVWLIHALFYNTSICVYSGTPATPATPANIVQGLPDWASQITNTDTVAAVAQILQSPQGQQVSEHVHPTFIKQTQDFMGK